MTGLRMDVWQTVFADAPSRARAVRLAASRAIRHRPFPPRPEYLADCERLVDRGWFGRASSEDGVLFFLSQSGHTALELGVPVGDAKESMN